jgi:hypothetical protein
MVHRGNTREPKFLKPRKFSSSEDKWRRHKNKERIWRRCVLKLAAVQKTDIPATA